MQPTLLDYYKEHLELQPSLFRESNNLNLLIQSIFSAIDNQQKDFLWLSQSILNVDLSQGWQLDFIGNIVGQNRILVDFNDNVYFGFDKAYRSETFGSTLDPFIGGYWNSRSYFNKATAKTLNDEEYRRVIKARVIFNSSNCTSNDLLEVLNLLTNNNTSSTQIISHGLIAIRTNDTTGLLNYFVSRLTALDNILPIAAGVRIELRDENSTPSSLDPVADALSDLVNVHLTDKEL